MSTALSNRHKHETAPYTVCITITSLEPKPALIATPKLLHQRVWVSAPNFVTPPPASPRSSPSLVHDRVPTASAHVCESPVLLPTHTDMTELFPPLPATATLAFSKSRRLIMRSWFLLTGLALVSFPCLTFTMYQQTRLMSAKPIVMPTIYILSHRRSGTHLTMDLLSIILPPPMRIVKTNHVYLTNSTAKQDVEEGINCRCLNFLRRTGKIVHAHRDVRDVVISSFYYYHSFKAGFIKHLNKTQYLNNEDGVRDMIIGKWVNTTVPFFVQPDIFHLYFTDSVSGFAHIHDRIATFFGHDHPMQLEGDPRKMNSASKAVSRHIGKGDHGYKLEMPASTQDEVLQLARALQEEKRKNIVDCPPRTHPVSRAFDAVRDAFRDGFWVGGNKTNGLFAPSYCPKIMERSKILIVR